MPSEFNHINCKVIVDQDGPNVDQCGNRFSIDTESVTWTTDIDWAGFCGCGEIDVVNRSMIAYLEGCERSDTEIVRASPEEQYDACGGEVGFYFCAYAADAAGWTDHGGTVRYAWLTDQGRQALAALRAQDEGTTDA